MTIDISLPELGDGIDSGDVLEVLVKEGDKIDVDQGILELETDKATVEVPSTHAGIVQQIHVNPGQSLKIGEMLITLDVASTDQSPAQSATSPSDSSIGQQPKDKGISASRSNVTAPTPPATTIPPSPASMTSDSATASSNEHAVPAGPAIRRFAREVGVDLRRVQGTGSGGRITREDVLEVVRMANQAAQTAAGDTLVTSTADRVDSGSGERDAWGPVRHMRLTKIRKTIAARMHESWSTIPRVTNFDDADVTRLEDMRHLAKEDYSDAGIKLTTMPFVIKAVAMALKSHPDINASLDLENDRIIYKEYVNIGIAVDTERGLVVASLRGADRLSIPDLARALAKLATKSRNNDFSLDDLRGGTFTISNLGAVGGRYSTPIINSPEVAILLIGRSRKTPVAIDDNVEIRLMMPLSLSYDHRLVDGAVAARFLNDVVRFLESPSRTLLAP